MEPLLDIIVTHYNEPWETGMKFFDMLALQRGVNFEDFTVTIVQDGEETTLPWDNLLDGYPFSYRVETISHGGVSRARNHGLEVSTSDWILFCDFDDTFCSIHGLRRFFENMHYETDMIFCHLYGERMNGAEPYTLDRYNRNDTFIHGKMFSRAFLMNSGLRFDPDVTYSEDFLFCHVLNVLINHGRITEIPEVLYTRCWNESSVCRDDKNVFRNAVGTFKSRNALIRAYKILNCPKNYTATVVKTALDYYYAITCKNYPEPDYFKQDFRNFWNEYEDVFRSAPDDIVAYANDQAFDEAANKGFVTIPTITFRDWVDKILSKGDEHNA